jgi:hypothetical protein
MWLQRSGVAIAHVDCDTCAGFANHRCRCPGGRQGDRVSAKYARRAKRFGRFLSECGVVDRQCRRDRCRWNLEWSNSRTGCAGTAG